MMMSESAPPPLVREPSMQASRPAPAPSSNNSEIFVDQKKIEAKKKSEEARLKIRDYIRNERDTIQRKWLALQECVNSEERRKEQFQKMQELMATRHLPVAVSKLIKTLKRCVRKEIRDVGGNPHSIIRAMFIYWDADKTGELSHAEVKACINNLGVDISDQDVDEIIRYYDVGKGTNQLEYKKLLADVAYGEPSLFEYVEQEKDFDIGERYEDNRDQKIVTPPVVIEFIDAVRAVIARKMRKEGGTVLSHLRDAFLKFDHDYSNALDSNELILSMKANLKLQMSQAQADAIVSHYDTNGNNQMSYDALAKDVLKDQAPMLYHEELTKRTHDAMQERERNNAFITQKFEPAHSKIVEMFKRKVVSSIEGKLRSEGGSIRSVVRNAFIRYDPTLSGTISKASELMQCVRKFGFSITEEEARVIMRTYDKYGDGRMEYNMITSDILKSDPSIVQFADQFDKSSATSRTPPDVMKSINKIKVATDRFVDKSHGDLQARDLLHGTFMRFDTRKLGRVNFSELGNVLAELKVNLSDTQKDKLIVWFDSNASNGLDYNMLVKQLYGDDVSTRTFKLPPMKKMHMSKSGYSETFANSLPPMMTARGTRSLEVKETHKEKKHRKEERHKIIMAEKIRLEEKIKALDQQKKHILDQRKLQKGDHTL